MTGTGSSVSTGRILKKKKKKRQILLTILLCHQEANILVKYVVKTGSDQSVRSKT